MTQAGAVRRPSLPAHLGSAFSLADARDAGVSASRLRAQDVEIPFRGVRARRERVETLGAEGLIRERAHRYAQRMTEHEFFTHATAAVLWDLPVPISLLGAERLDVGVHWPRRAPASRAIRGYSLRPELVRLQAHPRRGFSLASPASVWAQSPAFLTRVEDVVALGDAATRVPLHPDDPPALATVSQLQAALDAGRRTGIALLRRALPLIDPRARSRPETWLRLLLRTAGMPAPGVNLDVVVNGRWLAQVDLAYPAHRLALEYEGEHHLTDAAQWARDIARVERLTEAGWRVIRVTKRDVFSTPGVLVARVRRALAERE
ncbi:hypothetical protein ABXJ56_07865 [Microbacterium chocolatum]|uniref:endonuclease domain-containing protein n=1 Tax=Microbacterium aurantiacum TaxID=162393 RepID=UPI00338E3E95